MPHRLKLIARRLRTNATSAEHRLWNGVRRQQIGGFRFRRQVILKGFVVDFACHEARLVIEVDGATHSSDAERARDMLRAAAVGSQGYSVLRFTNDEIFHNIDGVLETIRLKLIELRPRLQDDTSEGGASPLPNPPPQGGGNKRRRVRKLNRTAVREIWPPAAVLHGLQGFCKARPITQLVSGPAAFRHGSAKAPIPVRRRGRAKARACREPACSG
ncbi:endonuclease domain-containing protein [Methylocapsa sp. S129]|uniref:endonuclease domain-containing protein n=1 Tax=Methylocapsa sp. S129 TaxID=1641869 RepID=UPI00131E65A4|nr:DUF559 domain-containing protein [Methylocapsa sp. S129]